MKDIAIIPTYDRPEYLALCLTKLSKARGIDEKEIWICVDHHSNVKEDQEILRQTVRVVLDFMKILSGPTIRMIHRKAHATYGNSFNVLEAFREAYATDARYVYLLEDDVLVMPDYFEWHEEAQKWHPFVSCAGRINRSLNFAMNGPEAIDETYKSPLACVASPRAYGSWAACFTRQSLGLILKEVANQDFLNHIGPGNEQDIFIQRFMPRVRMYTPEGLTPAPWAESGLVYPTTNIELGFSVWPYVPRAYHMGWFSYHRTAGMKFNGSLEEKFAALSCAVSDPQKIKTMACLQEIDPYPTEPIKYVDGQLFLKADYRKKA